MSKQVKTIQIDMEVFKALQDRATPLQDNPNRVLRRVLGLDKKDARREKQPASA